MVSVNLLPVLIQFTVLYPVKHKVYSVESPAEGMIIKATRIIIYSSFDWKYCTDWQEN